MVKVEYPIQRFRMREEDGKEYIFDEFRKSWLKLTPEEWVRQNFLQYLVQVKHYPAALIAVETEIRLNELKKRCDIVVYRDAEPWMIVECKEMNEKLTEAVLRQVLRYNSSIPCPYLVITNGSYTHAWSIHGTESTELSDLPDWQ